MIILRRGYDGDYTIFDEREEDDIQIKDDGPTITPNVPKYDTERVPENNRPPGVSGPNGFISYADFMQQINLVYEGIVYWRKNLFLVPSGKHGNEFGKELICWIQQFNDGSQNCQMALKVCMILPAILPQKPSKNSKAKEYALRQEQRLNL